MLHREAQHPGALRRDEQRDPRPRPAREDHAVLSPMVIAGERNGPFTNERADDLERLLEAVDAVIERVTRRPRTRARASRSRRPGSARPSLMASSVVAIFARTRRAAEARGQDDRPELHTLGRRGDGAQQRPRLVDPASSGRRGGGRGGRRPRPSPRRPPPPAGPGRGSAGHDGVPSPSSSLIGRISPTFIAAPPPGAPGGPPPGARTRRRHCGGARRRGGAGGGAPRGRDRAARDGAAPRSRPPRRRRACERIGVGRAARGEPAIRRQLDGGHRAEHRLGREDGRAGRGRQGPARDRGEVGVAAHHGRPAAGDHAADGVDRRGHREDTASGRPSPSSRTPCGRSCDRAAGRSPRG